jgi:rod shape-determining protein MreC
VRWWPQRWPGRTRTRSAVSRPARLTPRQRVGAISLAALAAAFIALDLGGGSLQSAHGGVRGVLGSLYRGTDTVLGPVRRFVEAVPHAASDQNRMRDLEQRNARLRARLAHARADHATERQLEQLHLAAKSGGYRLVPARVLATNPAEGFDDTVTIDVGASSGVRAGQSVTVGPDLVGRVLHADPDTSVVLLTSDSESGVGARDQRSGQVGVVTGAGSGGYTFRPLDPHARVRAGDTLVTGPGRASSFVRGLTIGTVRSVHTAADGTPVASVEPAVSPTSLDLVGVVLIGGHAGTTRAPLGRHTELAAGR